MKHPVFGLKLGLCALAIGFSGLAQAVCEIPATTNATSVQEDSGNGTYNCAQHSTLKGDLRDATHLVRIPDNRGTTASWFLKPTENGKILDIRVVSVASNSGKRCNYTYSDLPIEGEGLTTTNGSLDTSSKTVTVCAVDLAGVDAPPPPPPEPVSTVGNSCNVDFDYNNADGTPTTDKKFDVAIGYSKQQVEGGLYEGAAVCANTADFTKQKQCVNECVPNTKPIPPGVDCDTAAHPDGRLPLECAPCVYDQNDPGTGLPYCWIYENRVNEVLGYFKPSPKKKTLSANIDVTTGSNCYTVTVGPMYGGRTYSYWYCQ